MAQDTQIKQLIEGLQKTLRTVGSSSKEQVKINQELLKVIALLESGLARNEEDARDLISKVRKGLELTDDVTQEWAKNRKVAKKDLDSIFIKFREIERIHGKINEKVEDYKDTLDDVNDALDLDIDLSKRLFESYKEINNAINQSRKAVEKFGVGAEEANKAMSQVINTTIAKKGLLTAVFDDMFSSLEGATGLIEKIQSDAQTMINNLSGLSVDVPVNFDLKSGKLESEVSSVKEMIELEGKARLAGLVDFFNKNEELQRDLARKIASSMPGNEIKFDIDTGEIKKAGFVLTKGSEDYEKALQSLDQIAIDQNALQTVSEMYMDIFELISKGAMRTEEQNKLLDQLNSNLDLGSQMLVKATIERQKELVVLGSSIEYEKARLKLMSKYATTLQLAENAVVRVGHGFDYINSILPAGIGELLGLQKVSFTLIDAHRKGVQAFFDEIGRGATKAEAVSKYLKSFGPSLRLALTPTTLMIAGIALVYKFVSDITDKYKEMSANMKVSLVQSKQIHDLQLDILTSQKNQFSTMEDIQAVQTAMIGSSGRVLGILDKSNKELILGLSETGKVFGYGAEQAVQLQRTFEQIGADKSVALALQQNLGLMSEMAGISPQIIAQDIVDAAEEIHTYFAGMPDQAVKAIIQIKRMGLSLKQAGQIAQKMLDLEGFMTDMYELQAMTGPGGIDFSRAFDKGLMGDIEGMTKEIMNQIGSTAELNQMDYLTRMKIAKTLGMSSEELAKSVLLREKMADLDPAMATALESNLDRMGDISKLSKDQIQDRLKQLQSTDRLSVAWDKIKGIFVKSLLPLVEIFANVLEGISPVLDIVVFGFKTLGTILGGILKVVSLILTPIKYLGSMLGVFSEKLDEVPEAIKGWISPVEKVTEPIAGMNTQLSSVAGTMGNIGGLVTSIGAGMAAWFVGKKLFAGLGAIKSTIGSTIKKIPVIGSLFGKTFGSIEESGTDAIKETQKSIDRLKVSELDVLKVNLPPIHLDPVPLQVVQPKLPPIQQDIIQKVTPPPTMMVKPIEQEVLQKIKKDPASISIRPIEQDVLQKAKQSPELHSLKPIEQKVIQTTTQSPQTRVLSGKIEETKKEKASTEPISKTKAVFKGIQSIASKTFAGMAFDAARSMLPLGESGKEAFDSVATHASVLFDGSSMFDGLFANLEYGIKKVFTKGIEEKISPMLDPITKKTRKAFEKIGDKIPGKGLLSKFFGKQPEIDVKPLQQTQEIVQKTVETIEPVKQMMPEPEQVKKTLPTPEVKAPVQQVSKFQKFKDIISGVFTGLADIIKSAWKALKSTLNEIVNFATGVLKKISGAIGDSIQKLLGGIAKGLNQFKTSALKGAAALLIVSSALWVTSKALQNFASVKWEDIGKALVSLGGLTASAMLLGKASGQILLGAAAIAVLGVALIPTAYALKLFNEIGWDDLGKAGVALVGLTAGILGLGAIMLSGVGAAAILAGSAALTIMSGTLVVFGSALMVAGKGLSIIGPQLESIVGQIRQFSTMDPMALFNVATGITAIGASLLAFSALNLGSGLMNSISSLVGKGPIEKLKELSDLASPLQIVSVAIESLSNSLKSFSEILGNLSLENLDVLKEVSKLDVGKLAPLEQQMELQTRTLPEVEFSPVTPNLELNPNQQRRTLKPLPPTRESTAQNIRVRTFEPQQDEAEAEIERIRAEVAQFGEGNGTKNIERLLRELINVMQQYANRPTQVTFDRPLVGQLYSAMKPFSNNIG